MGLLTAQVTVLKILQSSPFINQSKTQSPDGNFQGHPGDTHLLISDQSYVVFVITIPILWISTLRFKAIMTPGPQMESNRGDRIWMWAYVSLISKLLLLIVLQQRLNSPFSSLLFFLSLSLSPGLLHFAITETNSSVLFAFTSPSRECSSPAFSMIYFITSFRSGHNSLAVQASVPSLNTLLKTTNYFSQHTQAFISYPCYPAVSPPCHLLKIAFFYCLCHEFPPMRAELCLFCSQLNPSTYDRAWNVVGATEYLLNH